ncbi:MAG TPA: iron-containing alcohol dehydrogenase, partial [Acidimicrobiales bacterium]|nr:iron-containing alcohol dehydrogenase [Acidimicrobiales bacterium]
MAAGVEWSHVAYPQKAYFGPGMLARVGEVARELGISRAMLVTTSGRLASEAGQQLASRLGSRLASVFSGVRSHVPTSAVQSALSQARAEGVDAVVSFGGGSCMDAAKAVCFLAEQQEGTPGTSFLDRPAVKHLAIPTTYSGAEATPFFGMTDETTRRKSGAGGPTTLPVAVVYDPALTLKTPGRTSAETGMNALAHGVEASYSPSRSPEAEELALAAVRRVALALPQVVERP